MPTRTPSTTGLNWILLLGLVALTGCFSLAREEPPQQHYVLGGDPLVGATSESGGLAGLTIGIRRLRLASYLDPPFLVVRQGPNQISYSEFHRWGEQLDGGINRAVARYLADRAPFRGVDVAPWPPREAYDYLIQLSMERFEGAAPEDSSIEGVGHMRATWEIVRQQDGAVLARGVTEHRETGWMVGDYAGLVRSLDAGLNILSRDLVASLEELVSRSTALPAVNAGSSPAP